MFKFFLGNLLIFVTLVFWDSQSAALADKVDDWRECVTSKGLTMADVFYATEESHEILCVAKCLMQKMLEVGLPIIDSEREILEPLNCD